MSETVHYIGTATKVFLPKGETAIDYANRILKGRNKVVADYYEDAIECLTNLFGDEYFYHKRDKVLYIITKTEHSQDDEIIKAEKTENGIINYELRYYNGGAGFDECMDEAFDKI